jgi:hypothetical protein
LRVLTREVAPQLSRLSPAYLDPRITRPLGIPAEAPRIRTPDLGAHAPCGMTGYLWRVADTSRPEQVCVATGLLTDHDREGQVSAP